MSELRPCPRCGGKCYCNAVNRESWQGRSGIYVSCQRKSCRLAGRIYATRALAISAWNHRPVEDALVEALEDVDSTLCVCRHCIPPKGCNCDIHAAHRLIDAALKLVKEGRNER
jgi:hypothetical protein